MENASKALIMAAGVLIGVILLSLMAYMFLSFAMSSAEMHKDNEQNRLNQFNSQFDSYEGKEGLTIYDVVTVANLATESNIYYELPKLDAPPMGNNNYIAVRLLNRNISRYNKKNIEHGYVDNRNDNQYKQQITEYYNNLIKEGLQDMTDENTLREYDCTVQISDITGRVFLITFDAKIP